MTVFLHELKRAKLPLTIWTASVSFMLGICVLIYPEMATQMGDVSEMFADMGSFSAAFSMDQINFGEFTGFFAIECGNVLGLGGAFLPLLSAYLPLAKRKKSIPQNFC